MEEERDNGDRSGNEKGVQYITKEWQLGENIPKVFQRRMLWNQA
jgi:hypothetical protein